MKLHFLHLYESKVIDKCVDLEYVIVYTFYISGQLAHVLLLLEIILFKSERSICIRTLSLLIQ